MKKVWDSLNRDKENGVGDGYTLHLGDCIEVMQSFGACTVDAIVTDPP